MQDKSQQLGMPFGTASHRLKKQLFFKYIQLAKENFCYDCKKEILSSNDLSIQHKKVWLHVASKLFWDLNNIAFSHKKCNKIERPYRKGQIAQHGQINRYIKGCRCVLCKNAQKLSMRRYRKNKDL